MATVTAEKRSCLFFVGHPSVSGDLREELKGITQTRNELSRTVEQHCCGITVIIFIVLCCLSPHKYFYIYCQYIMALVMGMANRGNYSSAVLMKIYLLVFCGTCRVAF